MRSRDINDVMERYQFGDVNFKLHVELWEDPEGAAPVCKGDVMGLVCSMRPAPCFMVDYVRERTSYQHLKS